MRHERFRREATLGASLDHPNIVRVYDFDTREGISFLIMTFVRGDTFEERLRNDARVPTDQILRMVREIADALGYAHRRGIVHRDVKPSNILLDEDSGRALLADYGIARVEGAGEGRSSSAPARPARGLPVATRCTGTPRGDAVRRLGHATVSGDAAPGVLHLPIPPRGAPQRGRLLRPGGRADRERTPLERRGAGPRLSPGGEVLRAGKRRVRGAPGHTPGDPVRGRPGQTQRQGGGTSRRRGGGDDGPRVDRAVPRGHAWRGRHAPERRP